MPPYSPRVFPPTWPTLICAINTRHSTSDVRHSACAANCVCITQQVSLPSHNDSAQMIKLTTTQNCDCLFQNCRDYVMLQSQTCSIHTPELGSAFQRIIVLSIDVDKRARSPIPGGSPRLPGGLHRTLYTQSSCPARTASKLTDRGILLPDWSMMDI